MISSYTLILSGLFDTSLSNELTKGTSQGIHFYEAYDLALTTISFAFINSISKKTVLTKKHIKLRIDIATSSKAQRKPAHFMYQFMLKNGVYS